MNFTGLVKTTAKMVLLMTLLGCSRGGSKVSATAPRASTRPAPIEPPTTTPAGNERLPGSEKSLSDALKSADLIVIATIMRVPRRSPGAPSQSIYSPVEIQVDKALRGDASGMLRIDFEATDFPPEDAELPPKVGQRLIFLLTRRNSQAIKILYPTDQNIAECSRTATTRPAKLQRPATTDAGNKRLPGSEKSLSDALKATDLIVIATILRVPPADFAAPEHMFYSPVEIQVDKTLRRDLSGVLRVHIDVRDFPPEKAELPPKVGDRLIFLLKKNLQAVKVLYPTDENISACSKR